MPQRVEAPDVEDMMAAVVEKCQVRQIQTVSRDTREGEDAGPALQISAQTAAYLWSIGVVVRPLFLSDRHTHNRNKIFFTTLPEMCGTCKLL